ncbi:hypothetical protein KHA80_18435 [Anaerobacillus sp. HL2]|nr:hypothetical protein KHA80_18435 [Anaerobacillus sp. HL2]
MKTVLIAGGGVGSAKYTKILTAFPETFSGTASNYLYYRCKQKAKHKIEKFVINIKFGLWALQTCLWEYLKARMGINKSRWRYDVRSIDM